MVLCIDFDGTVVKHTKPLSSRIPVPHAIEVLKELIAAGHKLVGWTMRSNKGGTMYLQEAEEYYKLNDIVLYGSQRNPTQFAWTSSPKAYGSVYIDDAALGCPLLQDKGDVRPYVDWLEVRKLLIQQGIL